VPFKVPFLGKKENDGRSECNMIYCKNLCKCHVVPPSTIIKELSNKKTPKTKKKTPKVHLLKYTKK
jgi:hypothetical protein